MTPSDQGTNWYLEGYESRTGEYAHDVTLASLTSDILRPIPMADESDFPIDAAMHPIAGAKLEAL